MADFKSLPSLPDRRAVTSSCLTRLELGRCYDENTVLLCDGLDEEANGLFSVFGVRMVGLRSMLCFFRSTLSCCKGSRYDYDLFVYYGHKVGIFAVPVADKYLHLGRDL